MRSYELMLILESGLGKEKESKVLKKVKSWIKKASGKIKEEKEWGRRRFVYPIKKRSEGLYYLITLEAKEDLDKVFQEKTLLEDKILRYLLVRR